MLQHKVIKEEFNESHELSGLLDDAEDKPRSFKMKGISGIRSGKMHEHVIEDESPKVGFSPNVNESSVTTKAYDKLKMGGI
jgi:hypothetical protein